MANLLVRAKTGFSGLDFEVPAILPILLARSVTLSLAKPPAYYGIHSRRR